MSNITVFPKMKSIITSFMATNLVIVNSEWQLSLYVHYMLMLDPREAMYHGRVRANMQRLVKRDVIILSELAMNGRPEVHVDLGGLGIVYSSEQQRLTNLSNEQLRSRGIALISDWFSSEVAK